ncbi:MAG: putative motility protein [Lachnospiraceae bacterium]|nr:putative motility protein [Lachnospiraceae bacterium]
MDITALNNTALYALNTATTKTGETIGLAMLSNQLDMTDLLSNGMIRALENSVNPAVGSNFDVSV